MKTTEINDLINEAYGVRLPFPSIVDIKKHSTYLNKRQNQELKNGDAECVIRSIMDGDGAWRGIRAKQNYSRKQWILLLAGDELCLPIDIIKSKISNCIL